jgi:hypothetical protein
LQLILAQAEAFIGGLAVFHHFPEL